MFRKPGLWRRLLELSAEPAEGEGPAQGPRHCEESAPPGSGSGPGPGSGPGSLRPRESRPAALGTDLRGVLPALHLRSVRVQGLSWLLERRMGRAGKRTLSNTGPR